jgi:hypothetical protein
VRLSESKINVTIGSNGSMYFARLIQAERRRHAISGIIVPVPMAVRRTCRRTIPSSTSELLADTRARRPDKVSGDRHAGLCSVSWDVPAARTPVSAGTATSSGGVGAVGGTVEHQVYDRHGLPRRHVWDEHADRGRSTPPRRRSTARVCALSRWQHQVVQW